LSAEPDEIMPESPGEYWPLFWRIHGRWEKSQSQVGSKEGKNQENEDLEKHRAIK